MDCSTSAGLSDDEDNGVDDNADNDSILVQSSATENINDDGSDVDDLPVFMWTFAFI
jgi:hypothetical protein